MTRKRYPPTFKIQVVQEFLKEVYLNDYANPREARAGLSRYLAFYSHERPHQALNYQTPAEVYFQLIRTQERPG